MSQLRVSNGSNPGAVAGAIAHVLRAQNDVSLRAIGPNAVNQAVKALVIARSFLRDDGFDLFAVPEMIDVTIEGAERTAIHFSVQRLPMSGTL